MIEDAVWKIEDCERTCAEVGQSRVASPVRGVSESVITMFLVLFRN